MLSNIFLINNALTNCKNAAVHYSVFAAVESIGFPFSQSIIIIRKKTIPINNNIKDKESVS